MKRIEAVLLPPPPLPHPAQSAASSTTPRTALTDDKDRSRRLRMATPMANDRGSQWHARLKDATARWTAAVAFERLEAHATIGYVLRRHAGSAKCSTTDES